LAAADKYEVLDLKNISEDMIFNEITIENAIQTLINTDKYSATKVLDKILVFIALNLSIIDIISGTELKKFIVEKPDLVMKLYETISERSFLSNCENNCKNKNYIYGNL
jgi:hypothetical protein